MSCSYSTLLRIFNVTWSEETFNPLIKTRLRQLQQAIWGHITDYKQTKLDFPFWPIINYINLECLTYK